ncbi:MAG: hypothetical protein H0U73_05200 [Tatlockia sp.]|nr:hypothetical protein [Tatlockia sp.]
MKQIMLSLFFLLTLSAQTYAANWTSLNPWAVHGAFGMASFPGVPNQEGQTAVGRLSLGHALLTNALGQAGFEAGIQSGNTLHLLLPEESIEVLGGVPLKAEIKPLLDGLIGLKTRPFPGLPLITWLKGGVAYRQLQVDQLEVNHLKGFSPEIQIGLGYQINENASINLGYQKIWGKNPELIVDPETRTGILRNLPEQQALMLGVSFNFW